MGNVFKIFTFGLLVNKKRIIGWLIGIVAMMAMYMVFFPSVKDMATVKFEAMPQEIMRLFGMENMADLGNYSSYFGTIYQLVLIALSIYGATFASSIIISEEKNKSIEFLSSLHVSRREIYVGKYLVVTFSLLLVVILSTAVTILCGIVAGGESYNLNEILRMSIVSSLIPIFFSGIILLLAGFNVKVGTGAIGSFIVLLSYMLGYLSQLLGENGELLGYISPFATIGPISALESNSDIYGEFAVYAAIYIAATITGCILYNKRDFKI